MTEPPTPPANVWVTQYLVSCLPEDDPERFTWGFTVEMRSPGRWAVRHHGLVMRKDGTCRYESNPSSRTDRFKAAYRHDLDTALALARKYAPTLTVNGMTAADVLASRSVAEVSGAGRG